MNSIEQKVLNSVGLLSYYTPAANHNWAVHKTVFSKYGGTETDSRTKYRHKPLG